MNSWRRLHRKLSAWLALFAMLAAALLPTVSHALVAAGGGEWTEVCTMQGVRWVADRATPGDETAPASALALEHCAYCTHSGHQPGLPTPHDAVLVVQGASEAPAPFLHAPRTLFAWCSAQPRAPPTLA